MEVYLRWSARHSEDDIARVAAILALWSKRLIDGDTQDELLRRWTDGDRGPPS
jgi:hypothetical protein